MGQVVAADVEVEQLQEALEGADGHVIDPVAADGQLRHHREPAESVLF